MIFNLLSPPQGAGQNKMCHFTPNSCEQLTQQIWLDFVNGLGGDSGMDRRMEAIAISPSVGIITQFAKRQLRRSWHVTVIHMLSELLCIHSEWTIAFILYSIRVWAILSVVKTHREILFRSFPQFRILKLRKSASRY